VAVEVTPDQEEMVAAVEAAALADPGAPQAVAAAVAAEVMTVEEMNTVADITETAVVEVEMVAAAVEITVPSSPHLTTDTDIINVSY